MINHCRVATKGRTGKVASGRSWVARLEGREVRQRSAFQITRMEAAEMRAKSEVGPWMKGVFWLPRGLIKPI